MPAQLTLVAPSQCLVETLLKQLQALDRDLLAETVLLVPTQRLGTRILAGLLQRVGALFPPQILSFEQALQKMAEEPQRKKIAEMALEHLILTLLQQEDFQILRRGHQREIRLLYHELYDYQQRDLAFDRLRQYLAADIYRSERHIGSLFQRVDELDRLMQLIDRTLVQQGLIGRAEDLAAKARLFSPAKLWPKAQKIYLVAYTSMMPSWKPALLASAEDERLHFILHQAPKLWHETLPLKELISPLLTRVILHDNTETEEAPREASCFLASNPQEEVQWAFAQLESKMAQGLAAHDCAILVAKESVYAPLLRREAQKKSYACNIALAFPFASQPEGRCLGLLCDLILGQEECYRLLAFCEHPLVAARTWQRWPDFGKFLQKIRECGIYQGWQAIRLSLPEDEQSRWQELTTDWGAFFQEEPLSWADWKEELSSLAQRFAWFPGPKTSDLGHSSAEVFQAFLAQLTQLSLWDSKLISPKELASLCVQHLLKAEVRGLGEPLAGLQILSIPEARAMPFRFALLLGVEEGAFPQALPQDELLDNPLKKAAGLPGWDRLEAMEDQTFHLLWSRLPAISLTRSRSLLGAKARRSRFTEVLLAHSQTEEQSLTLPRELPRLKRPESYLLEAEGVPPLPVPEVFRRLSATRVETLLRCPYAFLLQSLGLSEWILPHWRGDPRQEGDWLHAVLEAFYSGKRGKLTLLEPWDDRADHWDKRALERLMLLSYRLAPQNKLQEPSSFFQLETEAWPRWINWQKSLGIHQRVTSEREWRLHESGTQPLERDFGFGPSLIHGRIDAIDHYQQWTIVTDFKRRALPSLKAGLRGEKPQLPFYWLALQTLRPELLQKPLVFGYWSILDGEWQTVFTNAAAREHPILNQWIPKQCPEQEQAWLYLEQSLNFRLEQLQAEQRLAFDASRCERCPYEGNCRKEDPLLRSRREQQETWQQRFQDATRSRGDSDAS